MDEEYINDRDIYFMKRVIELAKIAEEMDEVPVGALIVKDGEIIAEGYNMREMTKCATQHAEIVAIEAACKKLGGWRLPGATLYVTMEPCAMCAGAVINSRIERVVYGAPDLRFGAFGSLFDLSLLPLNHKSDIRGGVLKEECVAILSEYFAKKRTEEKKKRTEINFKKV